MCECARAFVCLLRYSVKSEARVCNAWDSLYRDIGICACQLMYVTVCVHILVSVQYVAQSMAMCVCYLRCSVNSDMCARIKQQLCLSVKEMDGKLFVQYQIVCKYESYLGNE